MKKKILWIIIGCIILLAILTGYRRINNRFADSKEVSIPMGEVAEYEEEMMISVVGKRSLNEEEKRNIYEKLKREQVGSTKMFEIEILVENTSNQEKTIELSRLTLESQGISNGILAGATDSNVNVTFLPGESKQLKYIYEVFGEWFSKKDWKKIEEREFWLTYTLYPEKRMLMLE